MKIKLSKTVSLKGRILSCVNPFSSRLSQPPALPARPSRRRRCASRWPRSRRRSIRITMTSPPTNALAQHIFDSLVRQDEKTNCIGRRRLLAERRQEPLDLQAARRREVLERQAFHRRGRGLHLPPHTLENEAKVSDSFADTTGNFASVETPDAQTLVITTKEPEPLLPNLLFGPQHPLGLDRRAWPDQLRHRQELRCHRSLADRDRLQ